MYFRLLSLVAFISLCLFILITAGTTFFAPNVLTQQNSPPVAHDDFYVVQGRTFYVPRPGFIGNDFDPDGDFFWSHNTSTTQYGQGSFGTQGDFSYTVNPVINYNVTDKWTYILYDQPPAPFPASTSNQATVTLFVILDGSGQDAGNPSCPSGVGKPVNVTNGNMYLQQTDYNLPNVGEAININRSYNSISQTTGLFGHGWSTQYDEHLNFYNNQMLRVVLADGKAVYFGRTDVTAPFAPLSSGFHGQIVKNADSTYTLMFKDGRVHQFDVNGRLLWLKDLNGNQTTLTYNLNGYLTGITDAFGRTLTLTPNANGYVGRISDGLGIVADYVYNPNGTLQSVIYPDNSKYQFNYITISNKILLTTVKDAYNNILEKHDYDSNGRATTSEVHGGVEKYTLDYSNSTYTQVTDALGRVTKYYYDKSRGRAAVTKVEGNCNCGSGSQITTYEYDSKLNLTKKIDALNRETTYTYDANGNQLTETNVLGTETFTYNSLGQVLTRTDRMSGVATNTYDPQGNLLTTKDPLNKTTTFTYTPLGQLKTITDARTNITTLTYDNFGRLTEIKDADNKVMTYGYDARARVTSTTNALNQTTAYEYDSRNRLKKITYPDTKFVTYNYDLAGRRTSMVDARNNTTTYGYDNAYRLTSITDPLNHTTGFGYDLMSNRTSVTDALNNTINYEYDNFDRLKKIIYPAATIGATRLEERLEYDAVGNVKKRIDAANRETLYDYDNAHRLFKITDADLKLTQFQYNNRSQMTKVTDALSQAYDFTYDPLGRVLTQTRAGLTMTFEYDGVGNRNKRTDYKGVVTTYVYDNLNRLRTIIYPNTSENVSLTYDALSQLKTATNQNGTVTFTYDNRNRVESVTDVWNKTVGYGYDANGNRDLLKLDGVNYAAYAYDLANRLTEITAADDSTQITFGYDNANKLTSRTYPNGILTTYDYDNMSRLKQLTDNSAITGLFDRQYAYDNTSQISEITEPFKTRRFGYDNLDRLTSVTPSTGTTETYAFDAVGNRTASHLSSTYTHQPFNKLTATVGATFGYDNNGNMTSRTDAGGAWIYEWDYENRLKKATRPDGQYVVYKYDALGRRVERSLNSGAFTKFTYDGQDVLVDDDSALGTVKYINGLGIDNKLRQKVNGQAQYFLADHLGSTNGLFDGSGGVVSQTDYDAFGNQTGVLNTRYGFTGRERDDFTGLMHYRARQYSPELGRFISEDPIGFAGGDTNIYGYVKNNPLRFNDPMGLARCNPFLGALAGGAMGAVGGGVLGAGGGAILGGAIGGGGGTLVVPGVGTIAGGAGGAAIGATAGAYVGSAIGAGIGIAAGWNYCSEDDSTTKCETKPKSNSPDRYLPPPPEIPGERFRCTKIRETDTHCLYECRSSARNSAIPHTVAKIPGVSCPGVIP